MHAALSSYRLFQKLLLSAHALLEVLGIDIKQYHQQIYKGAARCKVSGSCCVQV